MKNLILISLLSIFSLLSINAQKGAVTTASILLEEGKVDKAKEKLASALEHEYTKTWAKTYLVAMKAYTQGYLVTKDIKDLDKAYAYFTKAVEYNEKGDSKGKQVGKYTDDIKLAAVTHKGDFVNGGIEAYNKGDFKNATELFAKGVAFDQLPYYKEGEQAIDTGLIFNVGISASRAENREMAVKYLQQAANYGYQGELTYGLLTNEYKLMGKEDKMVETIKEALAKYPQEKQGLLLELINIYLKNEQTDEAYAYINKAIDQDKNNGTLFFARGVLEEKKEMLDAAKASYQKAIELDPKHFDSYYNLGVLNYNEATTFFNSIIEIKDNKAYNEGMEKAKKEFAKALPYFLKAVELKPDQSNFLASLKQVYYRMGEVEKSEEIQDRIDAL